MKWFKKALAFGLSVILAAGVLTGCTGNRLEETGELHIYNLVNSKTMHSSGFFEIVELLYRGRYSRVDFDYRTSETSYGAFCYGNGITPEIEEELQQFYDNVPTSMMKGKCEDVIIADTFYQWFEDVTPPDYNKMMCAGAFIDLKPVLAEVAPELDLSAYDSLLVDGKLYAVPVYREPYYLYSAENMLQKWGFDFNPKDSVLTFLRKCAAWQEEHADDPDAPVVFTRQAWKYLYYNIFNILGTGAVNYQTGTANFDDSAVLETLELLKALQSDYDEPLNDDLDGNSLTEIYDHALFGRSGGAYDCLMMRVQGFNYLHDQSVLVPLLQLDGKAATGSDTYLMVPDNAANKLNAVRYVALVLESIQKKQQDWSASIPMFYNRNIVFSWDGDEEALERNLERGGQLFYTSDDFADTVRYMYQNQGDVCMPSYWYHSLKNLFDSYLNGKITIDTLAFDVQSRLEIYITE